MKPDLTVLYRGPLASCNYGCEYCPFAKHPETRAERDMDARALERFVGWVEGWAGGSLAIFFTPWGEALVRKRYRESLVRLSRVPNVRKVAIQTNLSVGTRWAERADISKLGLWATYHPTETPRRIFVRRVLEARARGISISVGIVGLREYIGEAEALRAELPGDVYLWVNAYKRVPEYYDDATARRFLAVDPLFSLNNRRHPSFGKACRTGETVVSVDGVGDMRRCHFVPEVIGNLYRPDVQSALFRRPCPNETCGCHIGYVHLEELGADRMFGTGILERVPTDVRHLGTSFPEELQVSMSGR